MHVYLVLLYKQLAFFSLSCGAVKDLVAAIFASIHLEQMF
jgi:hypothetical protein